MTSDTFETRGIASIHGGGDSELVPSVEVASGETIKPGYFIYVSAGKAYACKNTDSHVTGVAEAPPGQALDTAITAGDTIQYYRIGQSTLAWVYYKSQSPAVNLLDGDEIVVSATDGMGAKWAYTDGTEKTDSPKFRVGRVVKDQTGSVTDNKLILVNLGAS